MIQVRNASYFKKVLLINLPGVEQGGYRPSPLGILYLAAFLKKHAPKVEVDVIDGAMEGESAVIKKIREIKPDLVGISVLTPSRLQAVKMATCTKKYSPSCKVVLGGIHSTLMWKQMMEHYPIIDYIVKGEGEKTLLDLVSGKKLKEIKGLVWRKDNEIINNPDRPLIKNLDTIPFPAYHMINPLKYPPRGSGIINGINLEKTTRFPVLFSRGCMGTCTFCSSWKVWRGYRFRSGKNVADEVEMLVKKYKAKSFNFQDDTLTGSRTEIINFCNEILNRKIKIAIHGTTRVDFIDREMLMLMKKAGFYSLSFGIESGSPSILKSINKKTDLEKIMSAVFLAKEAKIQICALIMSGLPGETDKDRQLTDQLIKKMKPEDIGSLGEVWIFPGTLLFQQAKNAGLIDDNFWLSKAPYYIYRGGLSGDPINRKLLIKDWYRFNLENTLIGKILNPLIFLKRRFLNVWIYHLKKCPKSFKNYREIQKSSKTILISFLYRLTRSKNDTEIVRECYLNFLKRDPDKFGFDYYLNLFQNKKIDKQKLIKIFKNSDEYKRLELTKKHNQKPQYIFKGLTGIKYLIRPNSVLDIDVIKDEIINKFLHINLKPLIHDDSVIFDIGANVGLLTLPFAKIFVPKGSVYAFEPVNTLVNHLNKNIKLNELQNVIVEQLALQNKRNINQISLTRRLAIHDDGLQNDGLSTIENNPTYNIGKELVNCSTVDKYVSEKNIAKLSLIKIDTEGAEYKILRGAQKTIERFKPIIIYESSPVIDKLINFKNGEESFKFIEKMGYKQYMMLDETKLLEMKKYTANLDQCNIICFHKQNLPSKIVHGLNKR